MTRATIPPEPWERQKGENTKRYEAFCRYRDSSPRSMAKVAKELGKSRQLLYRWSTEDSWVERVQAWDDEQDRIARQAQIEEIRKMRKRHADLATAMLVKSAKALQRIPEDEIKAGDVSRMVEVAAKLERVSRGDVGEVIEERDGGQAVPTVQFYMPDNGRDSVNTTKEAEDLIHHDRTAREGSDSSGLPQDATDGATI